MRKTLSAFAFLALVACLPACLESNDAVVMKTDGSGTIHSTYIVDTRKAGELIQVASLIYPDLDPENALDVNPTAPTWFKKFAAAAEGYTIEKSKQTTQGGKRTSNIEATFTSLAAAAKGGAFFSSKVRLDQDEEKRWVLSFKDSLANAEGFAEGIDVKAFLPNFQMQLDTLKLVRKLTLPTKIVESNGTVSEDGRTVEFTVDYERILEGSDLEMRVVFEGAEGMELEAFSYSPDLTVLQDRFSKPAPAELPVITPDAEGEGSGENPETPGDDAPPPGGSRGG